ncbi:hypothetical protein CL621_00095 [archaeon]|jgi:hypothetical protein|nr:hypothetical protein [archaeon]|tara:strand:+ start:546 stop:773 length:228 start_codon:yes stop_codon:yes gene_type:complete
MKPLTKKAKEEMLKLSEENNKLRFHNFNGVEFEVIGTYRNSNNTWSVHLRNNETRESKKIGWVEYQRMIRQYEKV